MADRIASLPMYDIPPLREATDAWWRGIAGHMRAAGLTDVPDELTRPGEGMEHWLRDDLLFSQTCGYPLMTSLAGRVTPVGTPCYGFAQCDGPNYCSVVVVHRNSRLRAPADLTGARLAVNMAASWSGHHALRLLPEVARCGTVVQSGSHRASMEAVASGRADAAAIDCVSYNLLARCEPDIVGGLRVLCRTPQVPGLPYIAGQNVTESEAALARGALRAALADPALSGVRVALGIIDIAPLDAGDYEILTGLLGTAGLELL